MKASRCADFQVLELHFVTLKEIKETTTVENKKGVFERNAKVSQCT